MVLDAAMQRAVCSAIGLVGLLHDGGGVTDVSSGMMGTERCDFGRLR